MTAVEYAVATLGLVSGISATIGYSVLATSPKLTKACCWISACTFGLTGCVWAAFSSDEPMMTRRMVGSLVGALSGLALTWALEQISEMKDKNSPPPAPGTPASEIVNNQGIVTHNQSGGTIL